MVGTPSSGMVSVAEADAMIFGYVLLNDWSARDIQTWEYQPLGPFQAKATATTISPWIVTKAALEPFRVPTPAARAAAAALPARARADALRHRARGRADARGRPGDRDQPDQRPRALLLAGAAARPSHELRLPDVDRRPARLGHDLRARDGRTAAACSSSPGTARSRCRSPAAAPAASSRTATG